MRLQSTLFDQLQNEFCPPLDTSLLAALIADIESDDNGSFVEPSSTDIANLRASLTELAAEAETSQLSEQYVNLNLGAGYSDDTTSTPSAYVGETSTSSTSGSVSSQSSFSSPLGFLQAALPHIKHDQLNRALSNTQPGDSEMDMWDLVAGILSEERIREMEERGLDGSEDADNMEDESPWNMVCSKKKVLRAGEHKTTGKKRKRNKPIALTDIRQQHRCAPVRSNSLDSPRGGPMPISDRWTQLSSLSTHVSTFLPPHEPSFFLSYFHSPSYSSPYAALFSALSTINRSHQPDVDKHIPVLVTLLEMLHTIYEDLNSEEHSRLRLDAELCVNATQGRGDDAFELAKLLRELDTDSSSGYLQMGVYHSSQPTSAPQNVSGPLKSLEPPPSPLPPKTQYTSVPPAVAHKPSPYQWQSVKRQKGPERIPQSLPMHIPAYTRDVNGMKIKGSGNGIGKCGKGDVGEIDEYRKRMNESMKKRDEMLKEAALMWQRGTSKSRGGEVAMYYAERARELQEMAKKDALHVAYMMVDAKREASNDANTLDLHGTTAAEAIYVVKETLKTIDVSAKPLKVITGRGSHSVNQVSVLKPAIRMGLVEDGWMVSSWDAGLIIRGRRAGAS
ncbi:uncharacterized protein BT62DRAFT_971166 [Guyanagaster necrorhizus]|uniref:Smr domain-containing protein n=1 Tax=Guyanagaster necrorhizus TaxID=856835 RepID=A0A9P7VNI8_9AGAR|nr:uncharacterized protein BT62DRAFT_971166 [Guyanagaster necrorhizus MCA 3950]KAG7444463.1 hypothetical protein BT62DRAFT_971166 [Guyanagaster necrorhizus MCA 3950]